MKTTLKLYSVYSIVSAALLLGGISAQAASESWTNAPVDNSWTNVANWSGAAFPGASNTTTTADSATFNTAIPGSGIGGAGDPITNGYDQGIGSLLFDTANCGAYVFGHSLNDSALQLVQNGGNDNCNITIGPAVVNPIIFNEALDFRAVSSQTYFLGITNNATAADATIYIPAITNLANSTTRQMIINLSGVNTGANTIAHIDNASSVQTAEGAFLLDVWGGRWVFSGPNNGNVWPQKTSASAPAHVIVHGGILEAQDPESLGGVTVGNFVVSNGVLQIDGVTLTNSGVTLGQGGEILMNGTGTNQQISIPAVTESATLATATSGSTMILSNVIGGVSSSMINIAGPGTVLLSSNSTYAGNWSVNAGTFQLGGPTLLPAGGFLTIKAGAEFDVSPLGAVNYSLPFTTFMATGTGTGVGSTAASLNAAAGGTITINTGISLNYAPTTFSGGDSTHPALYIPQGTLSISGNTFSVDNVSGTPLNVGTYLLVSQANGSISSGGNFAVDVTGSGLVAGTVGAIQVTGGSINLVVTVYVPKALTWQGGNPNENWDTTTLNWLNGASPSTFHDADNVTFNSTGDTNPVVSIVGSEAPGSVLVDTTQTNYMFSGSGSISGTATLTKMGTGTLIISNYNNYLGITVVSNGVLQAATNDAFSASSDITISNIATLDLNTFSNNIGALNGNGTVDTVAGGSAFVVVGNNNDNGTFSGTIKNTAGALGVTKAGTGTETLASANTYTGATAINNGTLRVSNPNALGSGASPVVVNAGTLDVSVNENVASIGGSGSIANNSTSTTNELTVLGSSTFGGVISDGSGGGGMSVLINGGTLTLNAPSTYSGGTYIASGATLSISDVSPTPAAGSGAIVASNNSAISMPGATSAAAGIGNTIVTVNNAQVTFTSGETQNGWTGLFVGGITATDIFSGGNMTIGGAGFNYQQFTNFFGTVEVTNGTIRSYGTLIGGNSTTFDFVGAGAWNHRDGGNTIHFGALAGDPTANIFGPTGSGSNPNTPDNYILGEANLNSVYSGTISGTNNIIKAGTGTLMLNGGSFTFTNVYSEGFLTITNIGYGSNSMFFVGSAIISNGVLALVAPEALTNDFTNTLASPSVVLDATAMGYISNELDDSGNPTNSFPVTNSIFEQIAGQTLNGVGTLKGNLLADQGSIFNPGLTTGAFNVTSNANLSGAVIMNLDDTNAVSTNSELLAQSITVNPSATLLVTNVGPGLFNGSTFVLFNHSVSFASVTLPATDPTGGTNYVWANHLSSNGSITLTSGGLTPAPATLPPIHAVVSGNTLTLSWTGYLGATLQVETNSLNIGLSNNWVTVPNSTSVTSTNITLNPNVNGAVFYRLTE